MPRLRSAPHLWYLHGMKMDAHDGRFPPRPRGAEARTCPPLP